jgi:hypothetical protein
VEFVLEGGRESIEFQKLARAPNGSSREWLIERALAVVDDMRSEGIPLTRVNLTRVGINTNIVVEVLGLIS